MWLANAWQDVRYGVRLMRRAPGFAAAPILTIALGIGATTAMFSVVYGVVLQPLPYGEPDRLVNLWSTAPKRGLPRAYVGMANVYDWRARNHVFEDIAVGARGRELQSDRRGRAGAAVCRRRVGQSVRRASASTPLLGRGVHRGRGRPIGHDRVAILTYGLWKRRFARRPGVVGRTISLSGNPYTVVGVMGPDFAYPTREYQIYTPLTFDPRRARQPDELLVSRGRALEARRHASQQAQAEMDVISAQIAQEHPRENDGIGAIVAPMLEDRSRRCGHRCTSCWRRCWRCC